MNNEVENTTPLVYYDKNDSTKLLLKFVLAL